jgi:hypothetical protein
MCKKLIYWASLVLVLGLAASVASGDVLVLLDFEGTDTWTDNWDDVQVTETSDAPEGSTTASTWEISGDGGGELVRHWIPPLDLSAYSHFNFYMKVTADPGAGSGTWLGVEGDDGGSGIWIEPLSDVPGFTVGEWLYVSIPFTTLLEDTWDTFPDDYSEVSVLVFWFESWSGTGFDVSIDYVTVSDTPEEGVLGVEPGQTEILITFSDLDQGGEVPVAEDYQPSELDGTGITTTWTDWDQFNDDIQGEGLRDHTVTWDPVVTSVYIYTGDVGGSIEFSSAVEVPSIWIFQDSWASTAVAGHLGGQEIWNVPADHPEQWVEITEGAGHKIDEIVAVGGYSRIDDITIGLGVSYSATDPSPADDADDVLRDVVLSWESGKYAATHNVYFGTSASAVSGATVTNPRDVLLIEGHDSNSYDPDVILDLGQTYFWRVDEVNAAPDNTVHRGEIWSFTAEPVGYPIADITATASSSAAGQGPENTVNGSGLDADDQHSTTATDMWLSALGGPQPSWIQFEFDRAYVLHELLVWNSNQTIEPSLGVGIMDVTIEYSQDGETWTKLDDARLNQASGDPSYTANTTVDMKGVVAQFVRLTAENNFTGILEQYGLSEVRFFSIPVLAREPDPQDGAIGVHPDVILGWRPGRQAATHDVYLSVNEQDVIDGTVDATTVTESSYDAGTLELGTTYHWRIDEGNEAEIPAIWPGDIWSFTTADHIVVDNFESYNGLDPSDPQSNRVFMVWKDGAGYGTPDNPPYSAGNGTGSLIGHAAPPFVEEQIVHDGSQSMPYFYDNTGLSGKANYSEVSVDISELAVGSDWTRASVKTLTLQFYGSPGNSTGEQMYLKINGVEVLYDGASSNLTHGIWQQWDIDLESLVGADLQNVTELIIGFRNGGGTGVVYFDNIRLNPAAPPIPDSQAPDDSKLVAHWDFEGDFTDATGKGHDGLAFGDPAIINDPLRGQVLEVDGDDRIGVSDAADLNYGANESITLTTWVNLNLADPLDGWRTIVAKGRTELGGSTDYVDTLYGFWVSGSSNWHVNSGGVNGDAQPAAGGQWHHLAFVQDGPANEGYFYIDGKVVMTGDSDSCDTTGRPLFIGAAGTDVAEFASESFKGRIDDVRIYNYALSELEIQYLALD